LRWSISGRIAKKAVKNKNCGFSKTFTFQKLAKMPVKTTPPVT
jgi:hypothetical protein